MNLVTMTDSVVFRADNESRDQRFTKEDKGLFTDDGFLTTHQNTETGELNLMRRSRVRSVKISKMIHIGERDMEMVGYFLVGMNRGRGSNILQTLDC